MVEGEQCSNMVYMITDTQYKIHAEKMAFRQSEWF